MKKIYLQANIKNIYVMRKVNLLKFFDVMKNGQIFFQNFLLFKAIADSFLM